MLLQLLTIVFLSVSTANSQPTAEHARSSCTPAATDIVFALDGSASVGIENFGFSLLIIEKSVNELDKLGLVGSGDTQTRMGVFQFGMFEELVCPLLDNADWIREALIGIFFQNAPSGDIAPAILFPITNNNLFGQARESVNKVLVVYTDCITSENPADIKAAKQKADDAGIEIILITTTRDTMPSCVNAITGGDPKRHYMAPDVTDVYQLTGCK